MGSRALEIFVLVAVLIVAAGNAACTGVTAQNGNASNSPISLNPSSVNFGSVNVGSTASQTVTVSNNGTTTVTISQATSSGAEFSVGGTTLPVNIAAGQQGSFIASFTPTTTGSAIGTITIATNASSSPVVNLSGTGVSGGSATLTWGASTSSVVGYNAYRGSSASGPYTLLNSAPVAQLTYKDTTVQAGQTYYWEVTAVGTDGLESAPTAPVSATIPSP